ncbi:hypothetical protein CTAYLR_006731 [Chrysophaeum taylorii]|uniref:Membrane transport protein MMPL domain-containing protein n=1 Tax=Chrysophaeum taylorii TaxID=2483200 RepID=A0AAD7UDG6_9STRA|nr:hypothetical protein CTAYLR_006731 [Chrysophaeum taylorii]
MGSSVVEEIAAKWAFATRRLRWVIVLASLGVLGTYSIAIKLLERANGDFALMKGTKSRRASMEVEKTFPSLARTQSMVVLVESEVPLGSLPNYCEWELSLVSAINAEYSCEASSSSTCFLRSVESWCALDAAGATPLGVDFVSPPGMTLVNATRALVSVTYSGRKSTTKRFRLNHWVDRRAKSLRDELGLGGLLELSTTGFDRLEEAGVDGTKKDLGNVDTRSLPLALVVMACTLGNLALLVVPLAAILCATVLEFTIMSMVSTTYQIVSFAPSVMMSLTLALSFDYSLFFCSRYLEARALSRPPEDRVRDVLESAGHTVVVSGTTLVACFLGLLCFPDRVLRGLAISVSVGLGAAMLFTLTLTPAILHIAGEELCGAQDKLNAFVRRRLYRVATRRHGPPDEDEDESYYEPLDDRKAPPKKPNAWERLTRYLWDDRRIAFGVVCGVVALSAPACRYCFDLRILADNALVAPATSAPAHAYERVERHFGGGAVAPYYLLFKGNTTTNMLSQSSLDYMDTVLFGFVTNATDRPAGPLDIVSLARLDGRKLTTQDYEACFANASSNPAVCPSLNILVAEYLTADRSSALAEIVLSGDAYATSGFDWIEDARRALHRAPARDDLYLDGVAAQYRDIIQTLYASFPIVVAATLAIVFVLLAISFSSVAAPLRSVAALCLTLSWTFGTAVLVYQRHNFFKAAPFFSTRGRGSGVHWLAPLVCFSIVVGLALDYDVFLLARVHEYRFLRGLDDRDALLAAVSRTGLIITSAGLIMAIAFSGLFLSTCTILNQCAWLLVCAVLYDTFVIRTLFMPSLLSLSREYAWWPTKPPLPTHDDQNDPAAGPRCSETPPPPLLDPPSSPPNLV